MQNMESGKSAKLDRMIEDFIIAVSEYVSSSQANLLMLFYKDMSDNELVVDMFRNKHGDLRSVQSIKEMFQPEQFGVFYKICYLTFLKRRQYRKGEDLIGEVHDSQFTPSLSHFIALAREHRDEVC